MATQVTSAVAVSARVVRVVFNSATDSTALVASAWVFVPSGAGPFYTPVAVSVAGVDSATVPTTVDVTIDQECSPGFAYSIACNGVTGVTSDSIHNLAFFWPIVPQVPADRDYSIIDLIPPVNIADDTTGDLAKFIACIQEVANLLWSDIDNWGNIFDIDKCPPDFVDLILAQLGNPVEVPNLTLAEKRKLCALLVGIYKIKGSLPGLKAAIKFFVGLPSQVFNFYGMGFVLGDGVLADGGYPGAGGGDPGTWVLGGGDPWAISIKCGTPGGVVLTADQLERVTEIVNKTKPSVAHIVQLNASFVAPTRADIKDNGGGSVTITCAAVTGATTFQAFYRGQPGVNEWNGSAVALTGAGPSALTVTPGTTTYWAACVNNTGTSVPGLLSNEVTNKLATPVLTSTPQTRNIHLSWPAVANATSYRLYKSTTAKVQPSAADNAPAPIRVNGLTFDDPMESGTTFYYIVVPMIADSEGFYSNEAHTTSL